MTKKYKNSPLIEVVCDFRFDLKNPSDATLPGVVYAAIKDEYPIKESRNIGTLVPIEGRPGETEMVVSAVAQFLNEDRSMLVQVGSNMLAINCLKQYPHWENFKPSVLKIFEIYVGLAVPRGLQRIALKSINKINLNTDSIRINDYFKFLPTTPDNIVNPLTKIDVLIESVFNEQRDVLRMRNSSSVPDSDNNIAFVLDLEFIMNKPGAVSVAQVDEWLEEAHAQLYSSFDNSLTEKMKAKFE